MKRKEFYGALTYSDAIEDVAVMVNPEAIEWAEYHQYILKEFDVEIVLYNDKRRREIDIEISFPIEEFNERRACGYVIESEGIPCIS